MRLLLVLLAAGGMLRADALADLRAALQKLPVREPVRLRVVQQGWDDEDGKRESYDHAFVVSDGPEGVKVAEGKAKRGGKGKGTRDEGATDYVQAQTSLLRDLEGAKVLEDRPDTLDGKPVRRLRLATLPDLDAESRSHLRNAVSECTFWLGQDGLPVAWSRKLEFRLRVALVFSMDMKLDLHRRFLKHRDRLVVVSEAMALKGKAMGHAFAAESRSEGRVEP
jgi:hypothetical protein